MRRRFPWLGLLLVLLLAAVLTPLLLEGLLPRRYGRAIDLNCGRELDFEEVMGIRLKAVVHRSILAENYIRYLAPLPADHHWQVIWTACRPAPWLAKHRPSPPAPRPGLLTDTVQELNQLLVDRTFGEQPEDRLSFAARGAAIERTLTILRQKDDPRVAFNYVQGIKRQLNDMDRPLEPADFPTAEQYLARLDN